MAGAAAGMLGREEAFNVASKAESKLGTANDLDQKRSILQEFNQDLVRLSPGGESTSVSDNTSIEKTVGALEQSLQPDNDQMFGVFNRLFRLVTDMTEVDPALQNIQQQALGNISQAAQTFGFQDPTQTPKNPGVTQSLNTPKPDPHILSAIQKGFQSEASTTPDPSMATSEQHSLAHTAMKFKLTPASTTNILKDLANDSGGRLGDMDPGRLSNNFADAAKSHLNMAEALKGHGLQEQIIEPAMNFTRAYKLSHGGLAPQPNDIANTFNVTGIHPDKTQEFGHALGQHIEEKNKIGGQLTREFLKPMPPRPSNGVHHNEDEHLQQAGKIMGDAPRQMPHGVKDAAISFKMSPQGQSFSNNEIAQGLKHAMMQGHKIEGVQDVQQHTQSYRQLFIGAADQRQNHDNIGRKIESPFAIPTGKEAPRPPGEDNKRS